jgi:CRP/FNR family transcriptional regulator, cyclic AMP receptor protein
MDTNVIDFHKDEIIFLEGQPSKCAYIIDSGNVGIYREDSLRHRFLICELGKNDLFGEMGLIDKYPRSATAIALSDTRCMIVERSRFNYLTKFNPHFMVSLIKSLTGRLRTTISTLNEPVASTKNSLTDKTTQHNYPRNKENKT